MSFWLSASNVSRSYPAIGTTPKVEALAPTNLSLQAGERLALIGPSGTGKSTLLGLLAGFDRPSTGEITVDSRSLIGMSSTDGIWRSCLPRTIHCWLGAAIACCASSAGRTL